jgi:hypothetical protein
MNDGQEFVLLNPQVEGDSLSGEIMPDDAVGAGRSYRPTIPVVVSLEDVRTLAVQRPTEIPWVLQGAVLVGVVAVAVAVGLK